MLKNENDLALREEKKQLNNEKLKRRITEIDFIRGIAVIVMVLDHVMYDFYQLLGVLFVDYPRKTDFTIKLQSFATKFWYWDVRNYIRYFFLFIFMALTGISCSFSRSNLKRGVKLFLLALGLTLVTFVIGKITNDRNFTIAFGIIHCISVSIILISLLDMLLEKVTYAKWIYLAVGVCMVAAGVFITFVYPGIHYISYGNDTAFNIIWKSLVGIYECGTDCYSLLLFGGQIFIGVFLGKLLYSNRKSLIVKGDYKNNLVTFIGRHSLIVYFAHQVIVPVILSVILLCFGFTLNI